MECDTCNFAGVVQGTCGTLGCKGGHPLRCRCVTVQRNPIRGECLIHGPLGPNLCGFDDGGQHEQGAHWNETEKTVWPCPTRETKPKSDEWLPTFIF